MNKKMLIFIAIITFIVILSGIILLNNSASGADVKITSANISKNEPDYTFSINLKNVGNKGDTITVEAYFYSWADTYWYLQTYEGKTVGYIDSKDTGSITLTGEHRFNPQSSEEPLKYQVVIIAHSPNNNRQLTSADEIGHVAYFGTDIYTEEFFR